jgi:acetoacetate decarboxylase
MANPIQNASAGTGGPKTNPGEISNWPMLKIKYLSDPERIAALLPPGIEPGDEPYVYVTFYNVPIEASPEYGTVISVEAKYKGEKGEFTIGYAISQEEPVLLCQQLWGQPKYLAQTTYFRYGDVVEAKCTHQGYTFIEFKGKVTGVAPIPADFTQNDWWIKCVRSWTMQPEQYDFPPHVVHVKALYGTAHMEKVEGTLTLRESPWDPMSEYLPIRGPVTAHLWQPVFKDRGINLAGPLDPKKYWPFVDTIAGSHWPGHNGGPRKGK